MDCIFCKIINDEIPSYTLYEDNIIKIFLDVNPKTAGHTLIVPKKHIRDLNEIDDDTLLYINTHVKKICNLITSTLKCDGFTIMNNLGSEQEVKHFHMHVIPRYKENNNISVEDVYNKLKNDTNN